MDYSFIRFSETLAEASNQRNSPLANILYSNAIQLLPNEHYLQKTNVEDGISFDGDFKATIVDCSDNELADITSNVEIYEYLDRNGVNQLDFEIYKIGVDFGRQPIHLKLKHTTSDAVYYSNPFLITEVDSDQTTRFDYFNHSYFQGISYDKTDFYQSIRLNLYFQGLEDKTEVSDYYQISTGNTISTRPLYKQLELYKSDSFNNFTFERTNILLLSDVIYIDGIRMSNKTTLKSGVRVGRTNDFNTEFACYKNYKEKYLPYPFIYVPLFLSSYSPNDVYFLATLPLTISGNFNRNITKGIGTIKLYKESVLIATYNENDISVVANSFSVPFSGVVSTIGDYLVEVSDGLFMNVLYVFSGITWNFSVIVGEFDSNDFDNVEFLTN